APLIEWFGRGPDIVKSLSDKLQILAAPFSAVRDLQRTLSPDSAKVGMNIEVSTYVQSAVAFLTPALGELVVFLAALFFFLVGRLVTATALSVAGLGWFPSLGPAWIAPAFFVGLATLEGHFITPNIVGRRLALSPVLVFVGLVFWTWLWGPMGALLATPLVIAGTVVANDFLPKNGVELPE